MVFLSDETIQATVRDTIGTSANKMSILHLYPQKAIKSVFTEVANIFNYDVDSIDLMLQNNRTGEAVVLNDNKHKTLREAGVSFDPDSRTSIILSQVKAKNMTLYVHGSSYEDDLLLGASASPTTVEAPPAQDPPPALMSIDFYIASRAHGSKDNTRSTMEGCNYVGLVNQAMTCYLNSLLQALYMTPEFRNALYNWEFDGSNPKNSIPFQLQKLFLNLQTSSKSAVETTDLTHSFGWDMQAAWEQHDIQELCRVMFDALETKFKDTKQSNLINDLYEGKMLDYVKCLECSTEKSREDTFQDIPLPVRPFGSTVAYNSVEEALRAFVQPETLDGNNQYHCEKCNKKCDAHKGLKFTKFPYLLTLHLKRFDFDYSTMNRIKLNDKVTFPEMLNLNSFLLNPHVAAEDCIIEEREAVVKCDDCSTTDSGSALDDESCIGNIDISSTSGPHADDNQDDDEGIDVSSGNNHNENDKNGLQEIEGPYFYELFSIMIHSGSASGGHYYAYIKDFTKNQWFCFNDQSVTTVTDDDINKTYGGGPQRGYYSGAYTSSTNAYMLMYRQIDEERNCECITPEQYPKHIKKLLQDMRDQEETDRLRKEKENDTYKIKIYCQIPGQNHMSDTKLFVFVDNTLAEVTSDAYDKFKLKDIVRLEDCRLVGYLKNLETIECSFPDNDIAFGYIANKFIDFLLEIKKPDAVFEDFKIGGVNMKVYLINLETEEVDGPSNIRVNMGETVQELKDRLGAMFNMDSVHIVQETYSNQPHYLEEMDVAVKFDPRCNGYKLYVSNAVDLDDPEKPFIISKLATVIDRFVHIIMLDIALPDTDIGTLEQLSIPALDMNQNLDKIEVGGGDRASNSSSLRVSPQPQSSEIFGDQSNSEDSSLSDSDRTLVGDAPGDNLVLLSSSSNSPADQPLAHVDLNDEYFVYHKQQHTTPDADMNWDDGLDMEQEAASNGCSMAQPIITRCSPFYYFKAQIPECAEPSTPDSRCCRVLVDKRMILAKLKKHLESIVGVPMEYFKIYRQYPHQDVEWNLLTDNLGTIKDGERLIVKLGRVLKLNEYPGKIYHLTPNGPEPFVFLFEWIIAKDALVGDVKREIVLQAKKQLMMNLECNRVRLRKKNWKNPAKIYLDDQKFSEDIPINNNFEIFVQDLQCEGEPAVNGELVLFVKKWYPSTLFLGPLHEVLLDGGSKTVDELKRQVARVSQIPLEFVEVAYPKSSFPCDTNVLDVHNTLDWKPESVQLECYPLQVYDDGSVFFYRDSRENLKELTAEEKKELNQSENKRLGRFSTKTYSPRRERGLKIYVDTSPKKEDEVFLD